MSPLWRELAKPKACGPRVGGHWMEGTLEPLWSHYARRPAQTGTKKPLWAHYGELATPRACSPRAVAVGH